MFLGFKLGPSYQSIRPYNSTGEKNYFRSKSTIVSSIHVFAGSHDTIGPGFRWMSFAHQPVSEPKSDSLNRCAIVSLYV